VLLLLLLLLLCCRYIVKLLVTAQAGGQVSNSRETVGGIIDVPAC
jgi:hypothetical protein